MHIHFRGLYSSVAAIVLGALCTRVAAAQAPTPGTYRVWLCAEKCTIADSSSAIGVATVVVMDDSSARSKNTLALLRSLRVIRRAEVGQLDNVCFYVSQAERRVANEELFFGIRANGVTGWQFAPPDRFTITVYTSPDAGYALRWTSPGDIREGEGWSYGWAGNTPFHRNAFFVARRLGEPAPSQCLTRDSSG